MVAHLWAPQFDAFGGGITAFSRELAAALNGPQRRVRLYGKLDQTAGWGGMPLWGAGRFPARLRTTAFAAGISVAAVRHRPDRIISTHLNFSPVAYLANRIRDIPYTLVAHGIDVHPNLPPRRLIALRQADQIIAVSEWTRRRVLALGGIKNERVHVLPNTYDETRFVTGTRPEYLVRRFQIQSNERVILTVARLDAAEGYKGYDRVLQALPEVIRHCGRVRFLIAGSGNDRLRVEKLARDLRVAKQVSFTGFIPEEELADHYRLADIFAMPSTGEGFGIVFLEAMGCGTAVLGGNQDGSVDALHQGRLGLLVDPTSVDAIRSGLISLLRNEGPALWFDHERLSAQVREIYGRKAFKEKVLHQFT